MLLKDVRNPQGKGKETIKGKDNMNHSSVSFDGRYSSIKWRNLPAAKFLAPLGIRLRPRTCLLSRAVSSDRAGGPGFEGWCKHDPVYVPFTCELTIHQDLHWCSIRIRSTVPTWRSNVTPILPFFSGKYDEWRQMGSNCVNCGTDSDKFSSLGRSRFGHLF